MERQRYEQIRSLLAQIRDLQSQLLDLLEEEELAQHASYLREAIDHLEHAVVEKVGRTVKAALVRINLRDAPYIFMRAIDGDTLEVEPPEELKGWARDIHVRFSGEQRGTGAGLY